MKQLYNASIIEEIRRDSDRAWEFQQTALQSKLDKMSLANALEHLTCLHLENEFIEDDGSQTRYFPCRDEEDTSGNRRFVPQVWPLRAKRAAVGRKGRCALDTDDLRRQQRGLQFFFGTDLNGRRYNAMPNPSPFALFHTTIASKHHEPQSSCHHDAQIRREKLTSIVEDTFGLASLLPGWATLYNDLDAGATIDHLHFHVAKLPPGHGPLPIQAAAARASNNEPTPRLRFGDNEDYPLTVFRFYGPKSSVVGPAASLLASWADQDPLSSRFNIVALNEDMGVSLYVVPRNRFQEFASGFPYRVGSMEVAGDFVYSKDDELLELQQGKINYTRLYRILKNVHPIAARDLK